MLEYSLCNHGQPGEVVMAHAPQDKAGAIGRVRPANVTLANG
jgi:hypothetical protein